jgi:hypothetical protein
MRDADNLVGYVSILKGIVILSWYHKLKQTTISIYAPEKG